MIGYKNVDEHKLLRLFCSKESLSAMPLLKDNKVFASDCKKAIYINAEVCQGEYEKTKRFNIELPPVEQELNIPLLSLQKAYDSLPKVETEEYDSEDCDYCFGGYDPQLSEKQEARNYHEANWQHILAQEAIEEQLKQKEI